MISKLEGKWIDVLSESKSHKSRSIDINPYLKSIFQELKQCLRKRYGSTLKDPGDHIGKVFKKSLKSIGASKEKHFHSLRHTYAVRSLIKKLPINELKMRMGHASVVTTEGYCQMNLRRISQDFPKLVSKVNKLKHHL